MDFKKHVAIAIIGSMLSGCMMSKTAFMNAPSSELDDLEVCRQLRATLKPHDPDNKSEQRIRLEKRIKEELETRRLTRRDCGRLVRANGEGIRQPSSFSDGAGQVVGIVAGIAAVAGIIAGQAYINSRTGGASSSSSFSSYGNNYAWDQFRGADGDLTWRCRDKSSGKFAGNWNCSGSKTDSTWPGWSK